MSFTELDNEKQLLFRIAEGDEQAFSVLYQHYHSKIYGVGMMYVKVHEIAEDITQQVFLKVWEQRAKLTGIENFNSFFFIIARNEIYNTLRKRTVQDNYRSFLKQLSEQESGTPEDLLIGKQSRTIMQRLISTLPERQQEAYRLSREKGLPYESIAKEMNISVATVKEHMSKALQQLKSLLLKHKNQLLLLIYLFAWRF